MSLALIVAIAVAAAILLGLLKGFSTTDLGSGSREPAAPDSDDAYALSQTDPAEALNRFGTPENYDQLREQGVDLRGLGYEPPEER